ncbi:hypothetical protein IFM89_011358 [Coptis chinensis]|uniref:APS kinase domain-containing protein n=1 Tax=Coptis chinensis TaxID=261450 RepID=A0A835HLW3_9MAGN|nr:hypothetical protein IFM89_011358 [Coptis chinensis]
MTSLGTKSILKISSSSSRNFSPSSNSLTKLGFLNLKEYDEVGFDRIVLKSKNFGVTKAIEESKTTFVNLKDSGLNEAKDCFPCNGNNHLAVSSVGKSTNIVWHECSIGKQDREKLLQQKGCVIWITGLSGSGKSTLACALSRGLHFRGNLTYILDGDNVRHGLNRDLSFKAEDRAENIRRIEETAMHVTLLPEGNFIEVFMDATLQLCEARDSKGLYKLARAGKIKGFTGIDDPYEPPSNCEIVLQAKDGNCSSPADMAKQVILYLEDNGFLQA